LRGFPEANIDIVVVKKTTASFFLTQDLRQWGATSSVRQPIRKHQNFSHKIAFTAEFDIEFPYIY